MLGAIVSAVFVESVPAPAEAEPGLVPAFEDALGAITSGEAELGMIPIENSVAGRVADIHHLMPISGLHIIA